MVVVASLPGEVLPAAIFSAMYIIAIGTGKDGYEMNGKYSAQCSPNVTEEILFQAESGQIYRLLELINLTSATARTGVKRNLFLTGESRPSATMPIQSSNLVGNPEPPLNLYPPACNVSASTGASTSGPFFLQR